VISAQLNGMDTVNAALRQRLEKLKVAAAPAVLAASALFEEEEKIQTPVKTGANRDSIATELIVDSGVQAIARIAPGMPYSRRLEFGFIGLDSMGRFYNQAPRPYVRPAWDMHKDEAVTVVRDVFREAI
jgi:hypothetical protein